MRWLTALTLLLAAAAVSAQEQPASPPEAPSDDQSILEAARAAAQEARRRDEDPQAARELYGRLLTEFPQSPHVPEALYELSEQFPYTPQGTAAALEHLRRLHRDHRATRAADRAVSRIEDLSGWTFSRIDEPIPSSALSNLPLERRFASRDPSGSESDFTVYHIPYEVMDKVYAELMTAQTVPLTDHRTPQVPREHWVKIDEQELKFSDRRLSQRGLADVYVYEASMRLRVPWDKHGNEPGTYVIEERIGDFTKLHWIELPSFGLVARSRGDRVMVFAHNPYNGRPAPGVAVTVRTKNKSVVTVTDGDGLAQVRLRREPAGEGEQDWIVVVGRVDKRTGRLGKDVRGVVVYPRPVEDERETLVHIATDRPVYRPGQTVHYKVIARHREQHKLSIPRPQTVRIEVRDPDDRVLATHEPTWNEAGSVTGSFELAATPPMGEYHVVAQLPVPDSYDDEGVYWAAMDGTSAWSQPFTVAAYRKPDYQVTVGVPEAGGVGEDGKVTADIRAAYFFGGPVAGATVRWKALREEQRYSWFNSRRLDWPRPPFEDPYSWFYKREQSWYWFDHWDWEHTDSVSGEGTTDEHGRLRISFPTEAGDSTTRHRLVLTVTDLAGLPVETEQVIPLPAAGLTVRTGYDRMFYEKGQRAVASARVTTPTGEPAAGATVTFTLMQATRVERFEEEDDEGFSIFDTRPTRSEVIEFEPYVTRRVQTDATGLARIRVPMNQVGRVRLRAKVEDDRGRTVADRADVFVAGETPDAWADLDEEYGELQVVPDRLAYEVGDTIRLLVRTPKAMHRLLLWVDGGTLHEARVVPIERNWAVIELKARAAFAPNVFIKVNGWAGGEAFAGGTELAVVPTGRFLDVKVSADRETYGPRQTMRVTVDTSDRTGPARSEVELAIVDESIFEIEQDDTPDLRRRFHPPRWDMTEYAATSPDYWEQSWGLVSSGGSAGVAQASTSLFGDMNGEEPMTPAFARSNFADTMHWAGQVKTDADGRATIEVDTPDNLTRWRIVARAVSGAERFGSGVSSVLTRQDVILRLSTPRFYNELDRGTVVAAVHNNLDKAGEFLVKLDAEGAAIEGDAEQRINVPPHGIAQVQWRLNVTNDESIAFRAAARSSLGADAVAKTIPVRPHAGDVYTSQSGVIDGEWRGVFALPQKIDPAKARMRVFIARPGVETVAEALPYLAGYPYGCVEQTMSRFLPSVVAGEAMRRLGSPDEKLEAELPKMVSQGLQRLYFYQHRDGGWGWWTNDSSHPYMTAYVVFGLARAKQAGFEVDAKTLRRGVAALEKQLAAMEADDRKAYGLNVYAQSLARGVLGDALKPRGERSVSIFDELDQAVTLDAAGFVKLLAQAEPRSVDERAYLVLAGRADLADGLPPTPGDGSSSADIRRAALILRALLAADEKDERIGAYVDYLMRRRRGAGWVSTLDSAYAVLALCALPVPDGDVRPVLTVNDKPVAAEHGRANVPTAVLRRGENNVRVEVSGGGRVYMSADLIYREKADSFEPVEGSMSVHRRFAKLVRIRDSIWDWRVIESGATVAVNDVIRVEVDVVGDVAREFVMLESPIAAGTEASTSHGGDDWDDWWWQDRVQVRDDRVQEAFESVGRRPGRLEYYLRPTLPGEYRIMPAVAFDMYEPNERASSASFVLRIAEAAKPSAAAE